jgi:saccharopine dehydrogenase-like NADP-dependent oxidoreductase
MKIVVLGGAGAMGQVAVRDLAASQPVGEVVVADVSVDRAEKLKRALGSDKIKSAYADLTNKQGLVNVLKGATAVINSTPYTYNVSVMEAALEAGCHYLDLGGLFHVTKKQLELDKKFKERELLAVLGMGAAPGMTNVMAAHAAHDLDQVESIEMTVAGTDFVESSHPFLPPYALDTILDEYAMEPMVYEDGHFVAKPPMSGETLVEMPEPVGKVKAFLTLHSEIATLPLTYQNKGIRHVTYKLGLPAEFHERAKFLVELGFGSTKAIKFTDDLGASLSPRKVLSKMIDQHAIPQGDPNDCEVVRVDVKGTHGGRSALIRMESIIYSHPEWKISCGALDTGVPPSIVAQMIGLNLIHSRGVLPPEQCVPPELFFLELAKRNIPMRKITDEAVSPPTPSSKKSGEVAKTKR